MRYACTFVMSHKMAATVNLTRNSVRSVSRSDLTRMTSPLERMTSKNSVVSSPEFPSETRYSTESCRKKSLKFQDVTSSFSCAYPFIVARLNRSYATSDGSCFKDWRWLVVISKSRSDVIACYRHCEVSEGHVFWVDRIEHRTFQLKDSETFEKNEHLNI